MMEFYIIGQTIRCSTPAIASQSLKYLEARFYFSGDSWAGHSKWAHFRQGETVFDFALDENDEITADKELNLTLGEWEVYVTGLDENDSRITTTVFIISVVQSGLIDEPLHPIPASVAEQIDVKASTALLMATAVKEMADAGEFDGDSFKVLGFFDTVAELENSITAPQPGDAYGVANGESYDNYIWDGINSIWVNNGPLAGTPGEDGEKGTTFTPVIDGNGNLSWTNDGGLANPEPVNIRGPQGEPGSAGAEGKSPYEIAKENGYTGTEATFNAALTAFPYHNARHAAGGADPITVEAGNIKNGAVTAEKIPDGELTRAKLANDALYSPVNIIPISSTPYELNIDNLGVLQQFGWVSGHTTIDTSFTMTAEADKLFPVGAEIPLLFTFGKSCSVNFLGGVYSATTGDTGQVQNRTYKFIDRFGMVVMKRITTNVGFGVWLIVGNVEVVS